MIEAFHFLRPLWLLLLRVDGGDNVAVAKGTIRPPRKFLPVERQFGGNHVGLTRLENTRRWRVSWPGARPCAER